MILNSNKEKFIFYTLPTILFVLLPFFLITGPFLSDFSVSLISLLFIIYSLKKNFFIYFNNKYFYFFLIFWFYLVLNSLINNFNFSSLKISFFFFRYGFFILAILTLINYNEKILKYFFYTLLVCFLFLIFDGFFQFFFGKNILGFKSPIPQRVASFFGEELILGSYLSRFWPIFFGLSFFFFEKKIKLFYSFILIFILTEVLIFMSGERTAFFFINLSAIFIILFSRNLAKIRFLTLIVSILIIILLSFINPSTKERVIDQTIIGMNLVNKTGDEKIILFTQTHQKIYESAYKMFLDNKLIGVGVKNFRNICKQKKYNVTENRHCFTHPHNYYLQLLSETGIIGFLFLIITILYFVINFFRHLLLKFKGKQYYSDVDICFLSGIIIYIWPFAPTGSFFNNWVNIILAINISIFIGIKTILAKNLEKR